MPLAKNAKGARIESCEKYQIWTEHWGFLLNLYSKSCCSSIANETLNPQQVAPLERSTDKAMSGQTQATRHKWSASITSHVAQVDAQKMNITLRSGKEGEEVGSNGSLFLPNNVLHMFVCLCLLSYLYFSLYFSCIPTRQRGWGSGL